MKKPKAEDFIFPNDPTGAKQWAAYSKAKAEWRLAKKNDEVVVDSEIKRLKKKINDIADGPALEYNCPYSKDSKFCEHYQKSAMKCIECIGHES
jgi:hypothetical protein